MDRRTTIKWMLTAAATAPLARLPDLAAAQEANEPKPYGTDPRLADKTYSPGDLWPLTFTPAQRRLATALCDVIIPADAMSPSASAVGVVDFIDEWISAPYPEHRDDRKTILAGFSWFDAEASRRFSKTTIELGADQLHAICDDICYVPKARASFAEAAAFFARYRDLTAGGFYTTPQGRKDLRYVGNTPLPRFDGPPLDVLKKVGLA
jgi:hypothetical protein